jgi:acetyltransferase
MTIRNLDALLHPRSVALIGASPRPGALGQLLARNLLRAGFEAEPGRPGAIYFVNPHAGLVEGQRCYPDVAALPEVPDLAVIATPPDTVPALIAELGARGTRGAVVITAGFGEGGVEAGQHRRQAILDAARPHLLRIVGPNCVGLIVPPIGLDASFAHLPVPAGGLAFVAQSGAVIVGVVDWAQPRGIGFSHLVSIGDMVDVDFGDMLDYLAADPRTTAILLYVEAVTNARKFMSAARAASRVKPVIVMKAGRHAEGARAAASHTGALAGADAVYDAAFRRAGMLRVTTLLELFEAAELLADDVAPHGDRLAIVTNGGGFGVLATDALIDEGGRLADLSDATIEQLDRVLPPTWSRANPVDIIGDAPGSRYVDTLECVLDDPAVDAVLVLNCPTAVASSTEAAAAVAAAIEDARAVGGRPPVIAGWIGDSAQALEARALLHGHGIPVFATPGEAVGAFMQRVRYARAQRLLLETPAARSAGPAATNAAPTGDAAGDAPDPRDEASAIIDHALAEHREWLSEAEAKSVLAAYGIPVVETVVAHDLDAVTAHASRLGFPIALKILSPDITHKSDVGGVALDLGSAEAARDAARRMVERIRAARPAARIEGFTVQPMVDLAGKQELILGMTEDPQFGPVLLFGHGGAAAEVIADRTLDLPPLNLALAAAMIDRTRVARLLAGYRDRPPADRHAIIDSLVRLSDLVVDRPEIVELDINPLLAAPDGVIALDARIRVAPPDRPGRVPLSISPYPRHLARRVTLEGIELELRPIRPEDEPLIREAIAELVPATDRPRYLAPLRDLSHETAALLTQVDYDRQLLLALLHGDRLIALGRLAADPDNLRADIELTARATPEAAAPTRDAALHLVLDALIAEARHRGIATLALRPDPAADPAPLRARGFTPSAPTDPSEDWLALLTASN